jgi:hypothetical protein
MLDIAQDLYYFDVQHSELLLLLCRYVSSIDTKCSRVVDYSELVSYRQPTIVRKLLLEGRLNPNKQTDYGTGWFPTKRLINQPPDGFVSLIPLYFHLVHFVYFPVVPTMYRLYNGLHEQSGIAVRCVGELSNYSVNKFASLVNTMTR